MVYYQKFLICVRATYPELEFRKMVVHSIGHSTISICEHLDSFLSAFYHFFFNISLRDMLA